MSNSRPAQIAANVRAEATRRAITGQQVARHLGLTQPATSRRMHGHVEFTASEIERLAHLFGVPVSRLYEEGPARDKQVSA